MNSTEKHRLDIFLVQSQLATTRAQAKMLIKDGTVTVNNQTITKAGHLVTAQDQIKINRDLFVSRGAYKLQHALQCFQLNPENLIAADIGASTGGFTEVLLQNKVQKVFAIDVGHSQLHPSILNDPRVINIERFNIRQIPVDQTSSTILPKPIQSLFQAPVDLSVIDLSFISLKTTLPHIIEITKPQGDIIALIKPQFETGPHETQPTQERKNLILAPSKAKQIKNQLLNWIEHNLSLKVINQTSSPITGKKGNHEFLAHFQKTNR